MYTQIYLCIHVYGSRIYIYIIQHLLMDPTLCYQFGITYLKKIKILTLKKTENLASESSIPMENSMHYTNTIHLWSTYYVSGFVLKVLTELCVSFF